MLTPKYTLCFNWGKIFHMKWTLTPWLRISLYIYSYNNCTRNYCLRGLDRKPHAPFSGTATAIEVYDFRIRRKYGVSIGMEEWRRGTVNSCCYQEEYRTITERRRWRMEPITSTSLFSYYIAESVTASDCYPRPCVRDLGYWALVVVCRGVIH